MNSLPLDAARLVEVFQHTVRASLLGGGAIVLVLALRLALRRRLSADVRCLLWLPVCALLVLPRLPDIGLSIGGEAFAMEHVDPKPPQLVVRVDAPTLVASTQSPPVTPAPSLSLTERLTLGWLIGGGALVTACLGSFLALRRRVLRSGESVPDEVAGLFASCARTMGLRRAPPVRITGAVKSPALMGMWRPVLLLPPSLRELLSPEELRMVMLHEAGHVKRHDLLFHWLSLMLLAVHWFNPLCWIALWLFRADRESACDAAVLRACKQVCRSTYGHTLLKLQAGLDLSLRFRPLVGILGSADMLRQRIVEIAHFGRASKKAGVTATFAIALASAGIAIMAAEPAKPPPAAGKDIQQTGTELITRVFKVTPEILREMAGTKDAGQPDVRAALQAYGVSFPEGASAAFVSSTSQLVVRNTRENLAMIEGAIGDPKKAPLQVYVTARMVVFDEKALGKGVWSLGNPDSPASSPPPETKPGQGLRLEGVFTDPQYQVIVRSLQSKGTQGAGPVESGFAGRLRSASSQVKAVLNLPSVTTKIGQRAIVEIVREISYGTEFDPPARGEKKARQVSSTVRSVGAKLEVEAVTPGEPNDIELNVAPELDGLLEWKQYKTDWGVSIPQPVIGHNRIATSIMLHDGNTVAFGGEAAVSNFLMDPNVKGDDALLAKVYPVLLFVTAKLIDPAGEPANPAKTDVERKRQQGEQQVTISVVSCEASLGKDDKDSLDWLIGTTALSGGKESAGAGDADRGVAPFAAAPPGVMALTGVFNDPQFRVVMRSLQNKGGVAVHRYSAKTVKGGQSKAEFDLEPLLPGKKLVVEPVVRPDGYTMDLTIGAPSLQPAGKVEVRGVRTTVTIWDKQTVGIGGLVSEDEKSKRGAMFFITAEMVPPATHEQPVLTK